MRVVMTLIFLPFLCLISLLSYAGETLTDKLSRPWGMAFVSDHQLLISERAGTLQLFDINSQQLLPVAGAPAVVFDGQGGLLDVAVPADFATHGWIYFTWSHQLDGRNAATALGRARLNLTQQPLRLSDWQTLLITRSGSTTRHHYGSRIAFDDSHVFFSVGDRGNRDNGQDLQTHAGSILRLNRDGSVPPDNPFSGRADALAEIWSYGHRNPQGLVWDGQHKRLWAIEHGPRGGDELNLIESGANYGWAEVSWGKEYWNPMYVGDARTKPGMKDPLKMYDPSIAPSSLLLYRGDLLAGALKLQHLNYIQLDNAEDVGVKGEKRLLSGLKERLRALAVDSQGRLYIASDSGKLYRYDQLPGG
ncbi:MULTISPECIES: PQQ-dependent sugar dehydrogenase [unclassified Thalassolituus]|uniref:PQQ-dependent sugar dehydrogenase n=1 Tax=unclassified Thalassolituus TaxID=2624967 RepID=UPI0025E99300|nr:MULTISPECIES: PQQ-dependent sugar dehydrogenase [unclassified Thalassolituus]